MAITRTQIAKQLLANGGRIALKGGADASGRDVDVSPAGNVSAGPSNTGGDGGNYTDRIIDIAERKRRQDLRDLATNQADDKLEEKLENFRDYGSGQRKFTNFLSKFSPFAKLSTKFGPLNNKDFFVDKVLGSKNFKDLTKQDFANLTDDEKEEVFGDYMSGRMSGATDAYGNPIGNTGDGVNQILPVDTTFAQAPSTEEQEPEVEEPFQLSRRFRAEGGIMNSDVVGGKFDFESARQMYGLGKLVKKVTKTVKKIAKSDIGKAALLYAGTAGLGALGAGAARAGTGFGIFAPSNVLSNVSTSFLRLKASPIGEKIFGVGVGEDMKRTGGLLNLIKDNPMAAIAGASALAGLLTPEQEEEAQELSRGEGIDIEAARRSILERAQGNITGDLRARRFRAEGGSMKEPVAKKTMPLLDLDGKEMDLRAEGGFVPIGRMEKADDVPARLSKNEFVFTADAVRNAGNGNVDKGAEVMYNMMKNLEAGGDVSEESQGLEGARKMFQTSQRLEEVL